MNGKPTGGSSADEVGGRPPFFVLSTERSGTLAIAETLDQAPDCACRHIAHPQLLEESAELAYGKGSADEVAARLEDRLPRTPTTVFGEANPRFAMIVPALRAAYPDARFVWLVRDGRNYVCSGLQLGWYEKDPAEDEWERWRLRADLLGEMAEEEWAELPRFERIAWSWTATNRMIADQLASVPDELQLRVSLEALESSLPELCGFLGIEPVERMRGRANSRRLADEPQHEDPANLVDRILTWHDWAPAQRVAFEERCGVVMDDLYPEWRDPEGVWRETPEEYPWVPMSELLAVAEEATRVEELERELAEERDRRERAMDEISRRSEELAEARAALEAIQASRSFRWGHAVAKLLHRGREAIAERRRSARTDSNR